MRRQVKTWYGFPLKKCGLIGSMEIASDIIITGNQVAQKRQPFEICSLSESGIWSVLTHFAKFQQRFSL